MSLLHVYRRSTEGFLQPSASPSSLFGGDLDLIRSPSIISAPASPTAALEEEQGQWETTITRPSYSKQRRSSSSQSRRVTFDSEAKHHDGLTSRNEILDSMIKRYFCHQKEVSELDVIDMCKRSIPSIKELHEDLQDILARVEEVAREGRPSVPVLPRGGGMCTKLGAVHVPYIKILDKVVEASAVRLARTQ